MTISLNGSKSIVAYDDPGNLNSYALAISSIDCRIYFSKRLENYWQDVNTCCSQIVKFHMNLIVVVGSTIF